jgi:phosphate-selective porin
MRKSLLVATALLIATPAVSQAKSLEELLVEKGVISKAEAKGSMGSSGAKVWWNEGTRLEFADSGLTTGFATHLETRYTYFDFDEDIAGSNISSFDVTKARVVMSGSALHNEFEYYLNADFVGAGDNTGNTGSTNLLDGWIQWNACDWASARMGQFKTMVSRQFNTEDYKLQFPDRAFATSFFHAGRQAGLAGMADFADGQFQVTAGVFNGNSTGEGINAPGVDNEVGGGIGVRYNHGGIDAHSESDVEHSEELGFTAGAAYYVDSGDVGGISRDLNLISVDAMMKLQGFSLAAEYYISNSDPDVGDDIEPQGFYAQAGYFVIPKKFEIAVRYGYIDGDDGNVIASTGGASTPADSIDEVNVALNYYFWAHHLKASLGYTHFRINPEDSELDEANLNKWVFQLSGYF